MPKNEAAWLPEVDEGNRSRQKRRRDRKVNEILLHTAEMVAERGYHMTNLDDIAEKLDLSKASIYHYFENKEALVFAALKSCGDYSREQIAGIANGDGTPTEKLASMIHRHIYMTAVERVEMSRLFLQPVDWPEGIAAAVNERNREHVSVFRSVIQAGIDNSEFASTDSRVANMGIQGAMALAPTWYGSELRGSSGEAVLVKLVKSIMLLVQPRSSATD